MHINLPHKVIANLFCYWQSPMSLSQGYKQKGDLMRPPFENR